MFKKRIAGFSFHELFWVFVAGCMIGVIVEVIFVYMATGVLENRKGLVIGPFNPIYGVGAALMLLVLYRFKRWPVLLMGCSALTGSVIEYVFSYLEESLFGTRSWDYSNEPFNLHGRISLKYAIFWALLGALFIYFVYPILSKIISLIKGNAGRIVTWAMLLFLICDAILSIAAVGRYRQRYYNPEQRNYMDAYLDKTYDDSTIEFIFPGMKRSREQNGIMGKEP